jgi:DNA repair exonuclease SbcCD nuclease subunit
MRFLHLADLHLDAAFQSRSRAVRESLRDAARSALSSAVDEALSRQVDVVLIAGDLFDSERLSIQTERFLLEALARLSTAGIQVVYATGNHDAGGESSAAGRLSWPALVTVVDSESPVRIEIQRDGLPVGYVTAAGHEGPRVTEDLSRSFPAPTGSLPEVALLHTQVKGARGEDRHDPYAPSELSRLTRAGFDYWALGHVHTRQTLSELPPVHYPGNTQGRTPRETGPKGGLFVEIERERPTQPEFLELGPIRWETLPVDGLESETDLTGVAKRIEEVWEERSEADPGSDETRWILRIELSGPSGLHRDWTDPQALEELARGLMPSLDLVYLEILADKLTPATRVQEYIQREDVLGEVLRLASELSDPEGPSPSEALGLNADDMLGLDPESRRDLDTYLRQLLEGGETALLSAFLEAGSGR